MPKNNNLKYIKKIHLFNLCYNSTLILWQQSPYQSQKLRHISPHCVRITIKKNRHFQINYTWIDLPTLTITIFAHLNLYCPTFFNLWWCESNFLRCDAFLCNKLIFLWQTHAMQQPDAVLVDLKICFCLNSNAKAIN